MKLPDIKAGLFLYLFQTVDQSVPVHVQMPCGLRDIEVIIQETVDDMNGLRLKKVRGAVAERFL